MRKRTRRLLSLLLSLLMVLSLAPTAFLSEGAGGIRPEDFSLHDNLGQLQGSGNTYSIVLEPKTDASSAAGTRISVLLAQNDDPDIRRTPVVWASKDSSVATWSQTSSENGEGREVSIVGQNPGTTEITASIGGVTCTIAVEVSGIRLSDELANPEKGLVLTENQSRTLREGEDYFLFGHAKNTTEKMTAQEATGKSFIYIQPPSSKSSVIIEGRQAGTGTVRLGLTGAGHSYSQEFRVEVTSTIEEIEWTEGCSPSAPLKFSALENLINQKCQLATGYPLKSVIGLSVPTDAGTLYLNYKSPEDVGAGVGSSVTYYARSAARGPYISDITFVPKSSFKGEEAVITFTGEADTGSSDQSRTFRCRIRVKLTDTKSELVVTTKREVPVKLDSTLFSKICQEQAGSPLDYVIFTQPPASQGGLYRDYKDEWNYAAKVSADDRCSRKDIDNITFVPAKGFVGEVRVSYAGYSVAGTRFNGELVVQVKQGLDDGISYNDNGGGKITFRRADFDAYCENATGLAISEISFTTPPASQGTLYLSWNGYTGTQVTDGTSYYPAQVDWITFIAADGFEGVVRVPFSGTSRSGETFTGTAELHIQSTGTGNGDINYACMPGQSVKLSVSDFANFCQTLTGKRLHYITFQTLPDFSQGALYHGRTSAGGMGTRVTMATKYFYSATPYIANLSFWATDQFHSVEIPFTGASVSGETFTGILAISTGAGAGSNAAGSVSYSVLGANLVRFSGKDFDDACRKATNNALAYLRFGLPGSGQGILYYDYRSETNPRALDTDTTLFLSGEVSVDKVSFMPAKGFAGTVSIPFTGWAIDGREFQGTVQISVGASDAMGGMVRYMSKGGPVHFNGDDFRMASGGSPATLRLTRIPSDSEGAVYYQYSNPTKYSWEGNTTTTYSLSSDPTISNLTFVPKAGFYGTVDIPYTAADAGGTQSAGVIRISVEEPNSSSVFTDLDSYSAQTKSAVEYLYAMGVVVGVGDGKYAPDASIRRRDFCVMLSRAFEFDVGSTAKGFSDVPAESYYAPAVNQMYALGVVNGIGKNMFSPNAAITRQDASLMVQRALSLAGISVPNGGSESLAAYGDRGRVAGYAQGAVGGLVQLGIFPTGSDGNLSPRSNLTRADMALLLHRAMTQ